MSRTLLRIVCCLNLAALAVCLGGCGGQRPAAQTSAPASDVDTTPAKGDWLIVHLPAEMPHLNPITSSDAYATRVMNDIYDTLLDRDPVSLEMLPNLAESWEESEDHLVYTFKLRDGLSFSDGHPLTAEDVRFSYEILMNPTTDAAALRGYFEHVTSCEVLDARTIRFTCSKPYYLHLVQLGNYLPIMPKHIFGSGDFNKHPNNLKPVGSGRYVLESWRSGLELVLARNPRYWGEAAGKPPVWFDKIVYKIITDDNAALQVLLAGGLDVKGMRPEEWEQRTNTPDFVARFNKYETIRAAFNYIGWNMRRPMFSDRRVRQALTMLMDRETLLATVLHGHARIQTGTFMLDTEECDPAIAPWPFDPATAVTLLDAAGWKDTNGDGIRDKDGVPFVFELLLTPGNIDGERICTFYQEELGRAGIKMQIRTVEWASLMEMVDKRQFDAMIAGWSLDADPDPYQLWHSSQQERGSNYVGFANEEADRIIETARVTFDRQERVRLYRRFHQILHEEQPYTFLFQPASLAVVDKRVHGVVFHGLFPLRPRFEWYVPKALQRYR
jgi:peptide/nickel transport system substrate-binding protein